MERCNYNLDSYIECARRGETFEGRLVSHLLTSPSEDGGQWDMLVNLVEKYGVIPKVCFKDAQSAAESRILCGIINNKVTSLSKTCLKTFTCSIVQSIGQHIPVWQYYMQKYMSKANRLLYVTLILLLTVSDEGVLQETSDNGFWKGIRWRDPKGKIFNVAAGMLYFYFLIPKNTVIECFFLILQALYD